MLAEFAGNAECFLTAEGRKELKHTLYVFIAMLVLLLGSVLLLIGPPAHESTGNAWVYQTAQCKKWGSRSRIIVDRLGAPRTSTYTDCLEWK